MYSGLIINPLNVLSKKVLNCSSILFSCLSNPISARKVFNTSAKVFSLGSWAGGWTGGWTGAVDWFVAGAVAVVVVWGWFTVVFDGASAPPIILGIGEMYRLV